jgi:hypothetical protein
MQRCDRQAGKPNFLARETGLRSGSVATTVQTLAKPSKYSTPMTRIGYSRSTTSL